MARHYPRRRLHRPRCLAPDLIGFGQSGKPPISYRFADQARYLDAFIDAMEIEQAYLVAQDWGTALAFDLAARRPNLVTGLAFMELIRPMERWADFHQSEAARDTFRKFRTPGIGEELILDGNVFVERILPGSIVRPLAPKKWRPIARHFRPRKSRADVAPAERVAYRAATRRCLGPADPAHRRSQPPPIARCSSQAIPAHWFRRHSAPPSPPG
ncbi:alpha/beta fold hydrolase [Bosea thiooxidans]